MNKPQDLNNNGFKLHPLEYIGMLVFLLAGCLLGSHYAQGFIAWDDLHYMHTSWSLLVEPNILNRYFDIYLLKFFTAITAGDPFSGARLFGAFISSLTIVLVYLNARILAKTHPFWYGMLAVLFLLSFQLFTTNFGATLPDFTVAMMVAIGVTIYLLYHRLPAHQDLLVILFGLVLFLSYKTKETGLLLGVLIPGFLISEEKILRRRIIIRQLLLILAGVGIGLVLFVILNGLLIKDAFFGFSLSDIRAWLGQNELSTYVRTTDNYLDVVGLSAPFILALVWALKPDQRFTVNDRLLWLLSIGFIIFLNLTLIKANYNVIPRYVLPVYVVISILAPQAVRTDFIGSSWKERLRMGVIILGSFLIAGLGALTVYYLLARPANWEIKDYLKGIIGPIALLILIAWLVFSKRNTNVSLVVVMIGIGALTLPFAAVYINSVYKGNQVYQSNGRFQPFAEFSNIVTCNPGKILISGSIYETGGKLGRDRSSSWWMYDLYYRCHTQQDQVIFSNSPLKALNDSYQYVFLDVSDYRTLKSNAGAFQEATSLYSINPDSTQTTILLSRKP